MKKGRAAVKVIVIGAGVGGLTLAQGLRREGVDVEVYERDERRGRPQGISLHLDDRGTTALRECLPPGHFAMVEATLGGPRVDTLFMSEVDGELAVVRRQPLGGPPVPGRQVRARQGRQAHRPLLRAVLLTGLEDAVRFGAEFTRFERLADGTVRTSPTAARVPPTSWSVLTVSDRPSAASTSPTSR